MRFVRLIPALLANQAFFALATPANPFVIQEQTTLNVGDGFCNGDGSPPEVNLDSATFSGICKGRTAWFLGIPFAQPP